MTGTEITILSTAIGVAVGFLSSLWLARSSTTAAHLQNRRLLSEIAVLRELFAGVQTSVMETLPALVNTHTVVRGTGTFDSAIVQGATSSFLNPSVDVLVRSTLGTLVDQLGKVEMRRLLQEVDRSLGSSHSDATFDSLRRLRAEGVIDWDGEDIESGRTIQILPNH